MSNKTNGAKYIAETLRTYGVSHVFYVEAILRRTMVEMERLGIKRILAHSEKAAAYMADGFARAGNRPGVCMAQSVGAANLAAGLQDAFLGHCPVLAFTGRKPPIFQYRNAYQEIPHNRMFDPVTKYNAEVTTLEQIPYLLSQAFREATGGASGPVHLDFLGYEGDLSDLAEGSLEALPESTAVQVPPRRPAPEATFLQKAVVLLRASKKPVIVVGRGAVVSGAHDAIRLLAEELGAGVAYSMDGKEIMVDDHPLLLGPVGTYCRPCANTGVGEADLVFFVGTGTSDQVTKNWTLPTLGTTVIQLDIDAREIGRNYPGALGLVGDARTGIEELRKTFASDFGNPREDWKTRVAELVSGWRKSVEPTCSSDANPIRTERLCRDVSDWLPEDAVLVADTGYSAIWAGTLIAIRSDNQKFIRASGSLGWAFPAAIGAKCALPERPVVCFSGDGAFWYHFAELETAVRRNIPTITIINNNSVLGQSVLGIRRAYQGEEGAQEDQYKFRDTNFARLAEDIGALGIRVENSSDIRPALEKALASGRPTVIDVVTEAESHPVLK
jgi:acetolactate synthase-1/2/3 large subunit